MKNRHAHCFPRIAHSVTALVLTLTILLSLMPTAFAYYVSYPDEGTYIVTSACDSEYALDVTGGVLQTGSRIQLWEKNFTAAQMWILRRVDGDWYTIINAQSGLVLNVVNGDARDDARFQLYPDDGTYSCHFRFVAVENGQYIIQNRLSGERIVDLDNGNTTNGAVVHLWSYHSSMNGRWNLEKVGTDTGASTYTAYVATNGKNLNLRSAPSTSASVVAKLANGSSVTVLSTAGGWAKVQTTTGEQGYVADRYLTINKPASNAIDLAVPNYKQTDSRWGNAKIGTKRISQIGCLLTSASMVESYRTNSTIYPDAMKQKLKFSNNDLIWSSLTSLGYTHETRNTAMSSDLLCTIYQKLAAGRPVILGGKKSNGGQHWVVVKGCTASSANSLKASDFTINDPNSTTRTTVADFLRTYPTIVGLVY